MRKRNKAEVNVEENSIFGNVGYNEKRVETILLQICNKNSLADLTPNWLWEIWTLLQKGHSPNNHKSLMRLICDPEARTEHVLALELFLDSCATLTDAECQERAFERQQGIYNSRNSDLPKTDLELGFEKAYWKQELPDLLFNELYSLKEKYQFFTGGTSKKEYWIQEFRAFSKVIKSQPISSMVFPLLLTIFIVDEPLRSTVFPLLKYKNRRLSRASMDAVDDLYSEVKEKMGCLLEDKGYIAGKTIEPYPNEHHYPCITAFPPSLPVFDWDGLIKNFRIRQGLNVAEAQEAEGWFRLYRRKNGLSKQQEKELAQLRYGKNLRALAKLCNLNVFLTIRSGAGIPVKAKEPLRLLRDNRLISKRSGNGSGRGRKRDESDWDTLNEYLAPYYKDQPNVADLGLMRYFGLPMEPHIKAIDRAIFDLFDDFEYEMRKKTGELYNEYVKCQYGKHDQIWAGGQNIEELQCGKAFSYKIIQKFCEKDYRVFISNTDLTRNIDFLQYLKRFCNSHAINAYECAGIKLKLHLECEAYLTILSLTHVYLLKEFIHYWSSILSKLYEDSRSGGDSYKREEPPPGKAKGDS